MKKLYVSALDGTLLNSRGDLSAKTVEKLNVCMEQGMPLSIITSRTPTETHSIMDAIECNLPYAMMNGTLIYHPVQKKYIQVLDISQETAMVVLGIIKLHKLQCFLYSFQNETLSIYYDSVESRSLNKFRNERIMKYDMVFTEVDDLSICANRGVIQFCLRERRELLERLYRDLQAVRGAHASFYEDPYNPEWMYLEIYSDKASKEAALNTIKKWGQFDYIIGFGSRPEDYGMLRMCNETYAVSNATQEIQDLANGIIPSNEDEGVARFLYKAMRDSQTGL